MEKMNLTIVSKCDESQFDAYMLIPEGTLKKVMVLVHGMAEHKERYSYFMEELSKQGIASIIYDLRGHGKSVLGQENLGYFEDPDAHKLVQDLDDVIKVVHRRFPKTPVVLFGHSMGTLICRLYLKEHDDQIQALILSGAVVSNPLVPVAQGLVKVFQTIYGSYHRSRFIQKLVFGNYDLSCEGKLENRWLSYDEENVRKYNACPLDGFIFTLDGFETLFWMVKHTFDPKMWNLKNKDLPIFFIAGQTDPVIGSKEKWEQTQDALRKVGYTHVQGKLYPSMRHEILQEKEKDTVIHDILSFIQD